MTHIGTPSKGTVLSAAFLVGGTCIGGGMLALPVATGLSGFIPSIVMMGLCWLAMTITSLLFIEISLWMEEGVHVISMSSRILGPLGKAIAWILYLFICYASLVAYTAGGGIQIASSIEALFGFTLSKGWSCALFVFIFGSILYGGHLVVGRINSLLFIAMIGAYIALVGVGIGEIKPAFLTYSNWRTALLAVPLLLTSFSCQTMVPSLTPLLKRNARALRFAIIAGTTIAFIVYFIWQWLILGIVPVEGDNGLIVALLRGEPATQFLGSHVNGYWLASIAEYFAFFAIITSFLGIGLGLFDFLSDGLKIREKGVGNLSLAILVIVPTLFFAIYFERAFLIALETSGGYGDTILNGIMPALMVWIGRYKLSYEGEFKVPGGKPLLTLVVVFFSAVLVYEVLSQFDLMPSIFNIYGDQQ
ncbi:putative aromatic amino acid-specific transport protein [Chlamydiales bacterium STE3]|nr:putative aromatic amino acid-specific transport protein [Chlamydiales bacterium STE3]